MKHGTTSGYRSGCKCVKCKAAYAKYKREYLWARGVHQPMHLYLLHRRDGLPS